MEIYELEKRTSLRGENDLWEPWYDKAFGFTILAETEQEARTLASENCGDEGKEAWLDDKYSRCSVVSASGVSRIITRDLASA